MTCTAVRDATEAVRPLPMCLECKHWQEDGKPVTPLIVIEQRPHQVILCVRRIPAKPLPVEA